MPSSSDRDALIDALLADLKRKLQAELPEDTATLDQIEDAAHKIGGDLARELQRQIVHRRSRAPRDNQSACPHCYHPARYRDMVSRVITTRNGDLSLRRPYYWCGACRFGFAPLDAALGLDGATATPHVRLCAAQLAARLPFLEAATLLEQLTGIGLSASTLERIALACGTALRQALLQEAVRHQQGLLPESSARPQRLYISMDGVMTPLREGWRRDGSQGALICRYGECKTGVVYEAEPSPTGDAGVKRKTYVATLAEVDSFAALLGMVADQAGHHYAKELVVLGDGAVWIWRLAARQFPTAIQIVDFYHASQHLYTVAHARFGEASPEAVAWVKARQQELKEDQVEQVLAAIAEWEPTSAEKRHLRETEYGYFASNAERMRYGTYRRKGYHIGSGVVEAACKHVVGQRLDQAGMHWRQESAEAIVCLRAALLGTRAPDLRPYCRMAA